MAGFTRYNQQFNQGFYPFPMLGGSGGACNVYLFKSTDTDSLCLDSPFTGNVKLMLAAPAETGINADLLAGRQSAFVPSTDPVNAPAWVQYEANVTNLVELLASSFNGVVGVVGLGGVFYRVDSGAKIRNYYNLDGVNDSLINTPEIPLDVGSTVTIWFFGKANLSQYARFFGNTTFTLSCDTGIDGNKFRLVGCTAKLNGATVVSDSTPIPTSGAHKLVVTVTISSAFTRFGDVSGTGTSRYLGLTLFDIKVNNGSVYSYPVDDGWLVNPLIDNKGSGPNSTLTNGQEQSWFTNASYGDVGVSGSVKILNINPENWQQGACPPAWD